MNITLEEINIDYRDEGAGVPVIFLHAFPLNQTMWNDQVEALREHCRTITLDLRGLGNSDSSEGASSVDQMAGDVRTLMTALDIDRAILVGLSMGGYVSLAFYQNYPEAVRALVLADTRAGADTPEARERRLKSAETVEREGSRAIASDMIPLLLGHTTLTSRPQVVDRVRAMIEANSPRGIAAAQRAMAGRRDSTSLLSIIDCPVMVIVGNEDTLTSVAEAKSLAQGIPGARLVIVEGSGHLTNLEQPEVFAALVSEFVESVSGAS